MQRQIPLRGPKVTPRWHEKAHGKRLVNRFGLSIGKNAVRHGWGKFITPAEKFVKSTNKDMVYADRAGHDFMLARKKPGAGQRPYIRIEVGGLSPAGQHDGFKRGIRHQRIAFKIRNGAWKKNREHGAEVLVILHPADQKIYYGRVGEIAHYIQKNVPSGVRNRSFRTGNLPTWNVAPATLITAGLLQELPISEAGLLTEKIRKLDERDAT